MKKRFLPLLMALIMALSLLPTTAMAANTNIVVAPYDQAQFKKDFGVPDIYYYNNLGYENYSTDVAYGSPGKIMQFQPILHGYNYSYYPDYYYYKITDISDPKGILDGNIVVTAEDDPDNEFGCMQVAVRVKDDVSGTATFTIKVLLNYDGGEDEWYYHEYRISLTSKNGDDPQIPSKVNNVNELYVPVGYSGTFDFQSSVNYRNLSLKNLSVVSADSSKATAFGQIIGNRNTTARVAITGQAIGDTAVYATYQFTYYGSTYTYTEKINVHVYKPYELKIEEGSNDDFIHSLTFEGQRVYKNEHKFESYPTITKGSDVIGLNYCVDDDGDSIGEWVADYTDENDFTTLAVAFNVEGKKVGNGTVETTFGLYEGDQNHPSLHMFVDVVNVTVTEKTEKTGDLTITKELGGVKTNEIESKEFSFTVTGPNGYSRTFTLKDGEHKTLTDLAPGDYTVTEDEEGAKVDGYIVSTKYTTNNQDFSDNSLTVTVSAGDAASAKVINRYEEDGRTDTGSLTVVKDYVGVSNAYQQENNPPTPTFILSADGKEYRATVDDHYVAQFTNIPVGEYTLTEDVKSAQIDGFRLMDVRFEKSEASTNSLLTDEPTGNHYTVEITKNGTANVRCTNTYAELYTLTYDANGGKGAPASESKLPEDGKSEVTFTVSAQKPTRTDYEFLGWAKSKTAASAEFKADDSVTLTQPGTLTLYAVWKYVGGNTPETPDRDNDGTLVIRKTDANDGSKLTGEYFTVYKQSGSKWVEECTIRTTNGYASTGLDNGKYYVVESMAPAGYTLDETEHSFTISNNTVTLELTNDKTATPAALNDSDHFAYIIGYEDGTVQPSGNITRAEVATIFFRLLTDEVRDEYMSTSNPFSDVKSTAWYNRAVSTLYQLDILKGSNDGKFHPQDTITRAEFAAIAARFSDKKVSASTPFTDLAGHWAKDEVTAAASLGWVNGYTDGTFRPNQPITRAEAMTLVNRVLNRSPKSVDDLLDDMVKWPDNANPSKWYYLAVQEATNSHDYKASGSSESWTKLTKAPDWAALEH